VIESCQEALEQWKAHRASCARFEMDRFRVLFALYDWCPAQEIRDSMQLFKLDDPPHREKAKT
jgi:hypothetical protein